jgi:hypothetical protein
MVPPNLEANETTNSHNTFVQQAPQETLARDELA